MELKERIAKLEAVGVSITHEYEYRGEPGKDRHKVELEDRIEGILLPFSATEWCSMCMRESPWEDSQNSLYIGPCCGNTGFVQDVINEVFRDGGYISANDLAEIGPLLRGHDGWEPFKAEFSLEVALDPKRWEPGKKPFYSEDQTKIPDHLDPWDKICVIHAALEENLKLPRAQIPYKKREDKEDKPGKAMMSTLRSTLDRMVWSDLFSRSTSGKDFDIQTDEVKQRMIDESGTHALQRKLSLLKLVKPVQDMNKFVEELWEENRVEKGVALVLPGTEEILENAYGLCLFVNRESAQRVLDDWSEHETPESSRKRHGAEVHVPTFIHVDGLAEIVDVEISIKDGLKVIR